MKHILTIKMIVLISTLQHEHDVTFCKTISNFPINIYLIIYSLFVFDRKFLNLVQYTGQDKDTFIHYK